MHLSDARSITHSVMAACLVAFVFGGVAFAKLSNRGRRKQLENSHTLQTQTKLGS